MSRHDNLEIKLPKIDQLMKSINIIAQESSYDDKFTTDFVSLMTLLYSNQPIVKDLKIAISGDDNHISAFLEYTKTCDEYWQNIGCEAPEFIVTDENNVNYKRLHIITDEPLEDQLNDIMIHYV